MKNSKKYPGLKAEEKYNKLSKMITYSKANSICCFVGLALIEIFSAENGVVQMN